MKKVRMAKAADKKNSNSLSAEQKLTLAALREKKQLTRFLLPDAPLPKKQKRFECFSLVFFSLLYFVLSLNLKSVLPIII